MINSHCRVLLGCMTILPALASAQSPNALRLGVSPSIHEYHIGPTAPPRRLSDDKGNYALEGAIFGGALVGLTVALARTGQDGSSESHQLLYDVAGVAAFAGIGALIGSLIPK
jgi:hypothetical protein